MSYYRASLDPGEKCTCANEKAKEIYEAGGRYYPVDGYITSKAGTMVPLVGIPQMSDRKWQKAAAKKRNRQLYRGARKASGIA